MADTPTQDPAIQGAVSDVVQEIPSVVSDVKTQNVPGLLTDATTAYQNVGPLVPTILQETKAGYKTTEFWALIVWEIVSQTEVFFHLPGTWGKLVAGLGALSAYILSRGWAKSGVANQTPVN